MSKLTDKQLRQYAELSNLIEAEEAAVNKGLEIKKNTPKPKKRVGKGVQFKPGESGNPNGRPVIRFDEETKRLLKNGKPLKPADQVKMAQRLGPAAYEALGYVINYSDNETAVINAAKLVLDRGYGKPKQSVELSGEVTHTHTQAVTEVWSEIQAEEAKQTKQAEDAVFEEVEKEPVLADEDAVLWADVPSVDERDPIMFEISKIIDSKIEQQKKKRKSK